MTHESVHPHEPLDTSERFGVAPGREVYTADGEHIGAVKEVAGGYFKVNVRMLPDYWLQSQFVSRAEPGRITMDFTKDALDGYKLDSVPAQETPDPDAMAGMTHDPHIPENTAAATIQAAARRQERG